MAPAVGRAGTVKGLETKYPHGMDSVDGVPIVDGFGAAIKQAETLVHFKRSNRSWISRVAYYNKITPAALECGQDVVKDVYGGHWDY